LVDSFIVSSFILTRDLVQFGDYSLAVWIWTEFRSESGTYFCWALFYRSFGAAGPRIWNSPPCGLRTLDITYKHFKTLL